jgi:EpsD family peptidyl-prolyl cis-trans isomerase
LELKRGSLRVAAAVLVLTAAFGLASCGKKGESQAVVGQVIAHVGPDDITQQELDNELRIANVAVDKRTDAVVKAALSRIIERKYLVQQAVARKLDREPTVHLDLLRSRDTVLATAYVQRDLSAKATAIAKTEVDSYIQSHPDLFNKRQIYNIEQVSFAPTANMDMIAAATKDFKTIDQVDSKLNELNVKHTRGSGALDSATMPPEMLKAIQARKPDDVFFIRSKANATFFKVGSAEDKPLAGTDAEALAKRMIATDIAKQIGEETSKASLATTKFEGDYNRIMTTPTPAAAGTETTPAAEETAIPGAEAPGAEKPAEEKKQ